ncbi:unnamed protein product [Dibothriocephalus latus]|uniref:Acetyl-CoA carboxylase central domain-containing protein n=1 Tax=Dibothriocephalus latus TaxID=60516 RepID=A0A3P7P4L6_DIBLA|nr:unnamed protein product [Dibothriocephalus latus]
MLSNFPADKIVRLVEGHIASRRLESAGEPNATEASIASFQQTIKRLIDLADRYRQFDRCVNLLLTRHKAATSGSSSNGSFEGATSNRKATDMLPPISWTLPDSVQRLADPTSVTDVVSVESIILSAINNYNEHFPMENLQKLITCENSVYDVLLDFLYHPNPLVVSAALEAHPLLVWGVCPGENDSAL